ncbi:hypothetical protein PVK06_024018 [Gossypium arboreum]|uniref:Endonuclease/exonuclease/phosphatase domain-containing protein n=1 Tax=Gossypium arboreum TaxID=29729 RepID=A0ABR0PCV6_GOSAR|nr:hypothetical protein PVK06_024018 [Gossypium arboreum]
MDASGAQGNKQNNSDLMGLGVEDVNQNSLNFGATNNLISGNLERVKAHFNPAFEVSEAVDIQISEGALDPGKHSAVSFKENIIVDQQAKSGDRSVEKLGITLVSVCLLETRVSGAKDDCIIAKLGFHYSHRVEAIGFSGGHFPWIAIGDFNTILSSSEKFGGLTNGRRCPQFGDFVEKAELHDLSFRGSLFTWHRRALFESLDHALGNKAWIRTFPSSLVTQLPKIKSDHRPLLLNQNPEVILPRGRPFRFLAGWTEHPDFDNFMNANWSFTGDMANSLFKLTLNLK